MIENLLMYTCAKHCHKRWSSDKAIAKIKRCSFFCLTVYISETKVDSKLIPAGRHDSIHLFNMTRNSSGDRGVYPPEAMVRPTKMAGWVPPIFSEREFTFAMSSSVRPSVRPSVRLSVCNVRAPYSGDWNFRQCFYAISYVGHLTTSR